MRLCGCTKSFEGGTVLRFPELTLEPGQIYAAVGANGSGKSTFARLAAGVLPADQGVRVLEGADVGYMPQKSYAFRMSTRANVLLSGGDAARAEKLMRALGLSELSGRRASRLSGGETAKMALARVLMRSHDLLILDEPTASMDMESAMLTEELVETCRRETGCAVLLITHDLQQARRMADLALFFCRGELWESGEASKVLYEPERAETRRFLDFYGGNALACFD